MLQECLHHRTPLFATDGQDAEHNSERLQPGLQALDRVDDTIDVSVVERDPWEDDLIGRTLARISHQPSAAAADPRAVAGRTPSRRFDVFTTKPAASFSPCDPPPRRLDALATKAGEKCGLVVVDTEMLGGGRATGTTRSGSRAPAWRISLAMFLAILSLYGCGAARVFPAPARAVNSDLCRTYYAGLGVEQDRVEAFKYCRRAAVQGNAWAQGLLGWMYAQGDGVAQDYVEAARWLRQAAEQGNAAAQAYLGVMYFLGDGVGENPVEAVRWIRRAAVQRSGVGQALLDASDALRRANLQERRILIVAIVAGATAGVGVDGTGHQDLPLATASNTAPAIALLPAARPRQDELDTSEAFLEDLGNLREDGPVRVAGELARGDERAEASGPYIDRYAFKASSGEVISVDLGADDFDTRLMVEGPGDFRRSDDDSGPGTDSHLSTVLPATGTYTIVVTSFARNETGSYELQVASRADTVPAVGPAAGTQAAAHLLFDSCRLNYTADGGPVNHAEAFKYCRLAAERGHAPAQALLGGMYFRGDGVAQNNVEAARWIRRSAEQGLAPAQAFLGIMYYLAIGVAENPVEAVGWIRRSAEQGHAPGQALLDLTNALKQANRQERLTLVAAVVGADVGDTLAPVPPNMPPEEDAAETSRPPLEDLGDLLGDGPFHVEGALVSGDTRETSGRYKDHYTFLASAGKAIVSVDLESDDFDTRLMIEGPSDFRRSDDDSGPGTNSRLSSVVLPEAGIYTVVVTSYATDETGSYELSIESSFGGALPLNSGWVGFVGNDALNDEDGCAVAKESQSVSLVAFVPGDERFRMIFLLVSPAGRFTSNDVETTFASISGWSEERHDIAWRRASDNALLLTRSDTALGAMLFDVRTLRTLTVSPVIDGAPVRLTYDMRGLHDALTAIGCRVR